MDMIIELWSSLRVGTSVGHGEETGLGVGLLEVLVGELFTVDGLATSALVMLSVLILRGMLHCAYITTGEVTTLKHELRDDAVELGALVAVALLAGAESAEVLGGFGNYIVVELEVDAASLSCCKLVAALNAAALVL
jgi:hypothetical protein